MKAEKYVVKIGSMERSFRTNAEAVDWFAANYIHGLEWSFVKYINGEVVFAN